MGALGSWVTARRWSQLGRAGPPEIALPLQGKSVALCVSNWADPAHHPYQTPGLATTRFDCTFVTCFQDLHILKHDGRNTALQQAVLDSYQRNHEIVDMLVNVLEVVATSGSDVVEVFEFICDHGRHLSLIHI